MILHPFLRVKYSDEVGKEKFHTNRYHVNRSNSSLSKRIKKENIHGKLSEFRSKSESFSLTE
jgi:hypothetical protein